MVRLSYHKSYKYLIRLDGVQTQPPPNVKGERQKREYGYQMPSMTNIHSVKKRQKERKDQKDIKILKLEIGTRNVDR